METTLTSKVKKYKILYTKDKKKKNNKQFLDGYIRIHHSNCKTYLLSSDFAIIAETFYRSNSFRTSTLNGIKGGSSLPPDYQLKEDEIIEFEAWEAQIIDLIEVKETNLSELKSATQESRKVNLKLAQTWALEHDKSFSTTPKSQSASSSAPSRSRRSPASSSSSSKQFVPPSTSNPNPIASISKPSSYKGFQIAPPQSYHESSSSSNSKAKSNSLIRPPVSSSTKGRIKPTFNPYSRDLPNHLSNQNKSPSSTGFNQTPSRPSSNSNSNLSIHSSSSTPSSSSSTHSFKELMDQSNSPYITSTPSKATTQAFKPPSFLRNVVTKSRFSPDSSLKSTHAQGSHNLNGGERRGALEKGTLEMDWRGLE